MALSDIYETLGTDPDYPDAAKALDKARRLAECAQWAEFERLPNGQGLRLHEASFCRVRLCPMCQWRRSLKLGDQVRKVVSRANADHIKEAGPVALADDNIHREKRTGGKAGGRD